jgi:hypothetical protein
LWGGESEGKFLAQRRGFELWPAQNNLRGSLLHAKTFQSYSFSESYASVIDQMTLIYANSLGESGAGVRPSTAVART